MDYYKDTTKHSKGKHLSYGDRRELQGLLSNKSAHYSFRQLVKYSKCVPNTILNKIKYDVHHNTGRYRAKNLFCSSI